MRQSHHNEDGLWPLSWRQIFSAWPLIWHTQQKMVPQHMGYVLVILMKCTDSGACRRQAVAEKQAFYLLGSFMPEDATSLAQRQPHTCSRETPHRVGELHGALKLYCSGTLPVLTSIRFLYSSLWIGATCAHRKVNLISPHTYCIYLLMLIHTVKYLTWRRKIFFFQKRTSKRTTKLRPDCRWHLDKND